MGQARVRHTRGFGHAMEEHATIHMGFASGARGILDGGQGLPGSDIMTLVGSSGIITLHDEESLTVTNAQGAVRHDFTNQVSWDGCWDAAMRDIHALGKGGCPEPIIGFSHVVDSAEVNSAGYVLAVMRDRIDLPMHGELLDVLPLEQLSPPRPNHSPCTYDTMISATRKTYATRCNLATRSPLLGTFESDYPA
jgi:hypothetical protein